jgi:hypothetical protein
MRPSHTHTRLTTLILDLSRRAAGVSAAWLLALLCLALAGRASAANSPASDCGANFAAATNFGLNGGDRPAQVAIADFNRDGIPDLVTVNFGTRDVSVLLGNGSGGFGTAANFPLAGALAPLSVGVGDFNGDGFLDLVTGNRDTDNFSLLVGNGAGGFSAATNFTMGDGPRSVIVGDFNNDMKLDVATANEFSDNISVRLGNGDGTFQAAQTFGLNGGDHPFGIAVGDFNGDGRLDLVTTNIVSSNASVLLGNGDGTFQLAMTISLGGGTVVPVVAVGDANGDGNLDFAITVQSSDSVSILFGNGDGTFQPVVNLGLNGVQDPGGVVIADVNGDGVADVVTANTTSGNVSVLLSNGDGTFQPAVTFGLSGGFFLVWIAAGDLNRDGRIDLVTANLGSDDVSVLLSAPCPANPRVSDQKAGSLLVFPYYTSAADGSFSKSDTLITISNVCNGAATFAGVPNYSFLHLFFINGQNCSPADTFVCLTPNGSIQIKASDYDPTLTGYLIAVAVDSQGRPTQNNCFIGSAFVRDDANGVIDSYGAEAFWKYSPGSVSAAVGSSAAINLSGADYDLAPVQFSAQVQDPAVADEFIVLASVNGNLGTALGATSQTGAGVLYRADESPASFQPQIGAGCFSVTAVDKSKIRVVPGNLDTFLKDSYGYLKFISKQGPANQGINRFSGIRTLHKTAVGTATLLAPCFPPFCGF